MMDVDLLAPLFMPLTLLVVEDDPAIALALVDHFEAEGYGVVHALTGEDALTLLQRYHPHLVLADITLPYMDGYELVRKLRKLPAYRLLPIIFLTARGQVEDRVRGYQLGCDVYVAKPFDLVELTAIVRNDSVCNAGPFVSGSRTRIGAQTSIPRSGLARTRGAGVGFTMSRVIESQNWARTEAEPAHR
jgi:DNA-binding response OmpR family regulator